MSQELAIAIDATNLREGGGITHLAEILRVVEPADHGIARVVVFGGQATLAALPDRAWLEKVQPAELERGLWSRLTWQRFQLSGSAKAKGCEIFFVPGGSYFGALWPVVTMSRNMLPFEPREYRRYGWSLMRLKLWLLRIAQTRSMRRATGMIFLTDYARRKVQEAVGEIRGTVAQIPHGLNPRFRAPPKAQRDIQTYSQEHPFRLAYVSKVDAYKHQWNVVEAVAALRREGLPVALDLIGPAYPPSLKRLQESMAQWDPDGAWVRYHGAIRFSELHQTYLDADLGVFASSCENMPNILLETMAAGLPIAASSRGPTPEILGSAGEYFDPEQPSEIAAALRKLIASPSLRSERAGASYLAAQSYTWTRCASQTFAFLAKVARQPRKY